MKIHFGILALLNFPRMLIYSTDFYTKQTKQNLSKFGGQFLKHEFYEKTERTKFR